MDQKLVQNILIVVLIISVIGVGIGFLAKNCGGKSEESKQTISKPNLDYDKSVSAIANIGGDSGPGGYAAFSHSVKNIHDVILERLATDLELSEEDKKQVLWQYNKRHEKIAEDYYHQLLERRKGILVNSDKSFITYNTYKSTDEFGKILSSHICNLTGLVVTLATKTPAVGKAAAVILGKPCKYVLIELFKPIEDELKRIAIVEDYEISKVHIEKHMRDVIAELGTVKDNFKTTFNNKYVRKLILGLKSEAELSVHINSIVKAGFKLDKFLRLEYDHTLKQIIITLPEPEILSNEIRPKIINMENGTFIKIGKDKISEMIVKAQEWSYNEAIKSGILKKAKKNSKIILKTIFQPIAVTAYQPYKIIIEFQSADKEQIQIKLDDKDQVEVKK